jgi:hypothetical protein
MPLERLNLNTYAWTAQHFMGGWRREDPFDFDAPYQRGAVWSLDQKRNLIRSLVIGLPVGVVIYSELPLSGSHATDPAHPERVCRIIDGKQRILAIRQFTEGEFTVPAAWFNDEPGEVAWDGLRDQDRRAIENANVPGIGYVSHYTYVYGKSGGIVRDDKGRAKIRRRTPEETIAAEAELFLLVNMGGTAHDASTLARAAEVAGR